MTRYFFDVTEPTTVRYDYSGRNLSSLDQARELAELIAMDIGCRQADEIPGTVVQVRDTVGRQLLAVAVQPLTAVAA